MATAATAVDYVIYIYIYIYKDENTFSIYGSVLLHVPNAATAVDYVIYMCNIDTYIHTYIHIYMYM